MKKILAIGLALMLAVGITACTDPDHDKDQTQGGGKPTNVIVLPNEPVHYKPSAK